MVKRRDDLKRGRDSSSGKLPDLSQDLSMRDFIVVCIMTLHNVSKELIPGYTASDIFARA